MTTRKLTFHTDPGHGWLEVPRADLVDLGIVSSISAFSYQKGTRIYLEEDCDASLYLEAARAAGWRVNVREQYSDPCPVRDFPRYRPESPVLFAIDQLLKA